MLYDIIIVNTILIVFSTISAGLLYGPLLTAGYAAIHSSTVLVQRGAIKLFFKTLKARWLVSLLLFLIMVVIGGMGVFNLYLALTQNIGGGVMVALYLFIIIETMFIFTYAFPIAAVTTMNLKSVIKWSFILSHRHLLITIAASIFNSTGFILLFAIFGLRFLALSIGLFFFFGVIIAINSHLVIKRVISKAPFEKTYIVDEEDKSR
jgi:uncharacterized membrane protein YesL